MNSIKKTLANMKIESYYKGWIPDSSAALPYVCFTMGVVLFMIMFWCLLAFFLVAFKNVMETGLFDPKRVPKKKNKPKNSHEPEADADNNQPNEFGVNNEPTAHEIGELPNIQENLHDQFRTEPEHDAAVSDPVVAQSRSKAKKYRYHNDVRYVMDIIMISQKTFYTVIIFLMLAIMIHLNLLMVQSALKSYDLASGLSERDAAKTVPVHAGQVMFNCCACDINPVIKKDKPIEYFFGNGPIGVKPVDLYPVNTPIEKGTEPEDPDDLRSNF